MIVIGLRLCGHVHRGRAEPRLAARHSVAGVVSREGKGQEADALQPDQLAVSPHRRSACASEGRQRAAAGLGGADDPPVAAARPRRRGARHSAYDRPRSAARAGGQSLPRSGAGDGRRPAAGTRVEAGDGQGARSGDGGAQSRRRAGLGRGRRGRTLHRARLARRTPAGDRGGAGEPASRGRHAGALRRLVELSGGTVLRARVVRSQPRRQEGQAADRLRPAVRRDGAPSPSRCSTVRPPTRRRSPHRSRS